MRAVRTPRHLRYGTYGRYELVYTSSRSRCDCSLSRINVQAYRLGHMYDCERSPRACYALGNNLVPSWHCLTPQISAYASTSRVQHHPIRRSCHCQTSCRAATSSTRRTRIVSRRGSTKRPRHAGTARMLPRSMEHRLYPTKASLPILRNDSRAKTGNSQSWPKMTVPSPQWRL